MSKRGRRKEELGSKADADVEDVSEKAAPRRDTGAKPGAGTGLGKMLNNRKIIYAVILVVAVSIVAWRLSTFTLPAGTTTDITGQVVQQGTEPASQLGDIVKAGKNVKVEYTGKLLNGEEFDSGDIEFVVGAGQMIEGFEEAVVGMRVGEEKTATLPPEKAYGARDPSLVMIMPVVFAMERNLNITNEQFEGAFGEQPEVGKTYEAENVLLPLIVIDVVRDTVFLKRTAEAGRLIPASMEPWDMGVVSVNETSITLERKATDGMKIQTMIGEKEVLVKDGEMTIDMNHELAGKTLVFTIKVLSVTTLSPLDKVCSEVDLPKVDRPQVELHVFSFCPAGTGAQKNLIPVARILGDKADFRVRFFSHMHGEHEMVENMRQECIQEKEPAKYWDYLDKFIANVFPSCRNVDCLNEKDAVIMQELGIDAGAIDKCVENEGEDLYNTDRAIAGALSLSYSPSFIINGKYLSNIDRSPEGIKNTVCCAFKNPPEECSQTLTASSATQGVC